MTRSSQEEPKSPLLLALQNHQVTAEVTDCDHYRVHGGLAVETDYIVRVSPLRANKNSDGSDPNENQPPFGAFDMNKTYRAFRTFAQQLRDTTKAYDLVRRNYDRANIPSDCLVIAKYCQLVSHLIESQRTQCLGRVDYMYVKVLAKERKRVLNDVLEATVHSFPTCDTMERHAYVREVALIIQTFFLTDHCLEKQTVDDVVSPRESNITRDDTFLGAGKLLQKVKDEVKLDDLNPLNWLGKPPEDTANKEQQQHREESRTIASLSFRARRSDAQRNLDDTELARFGEEARLLLDGERPRTEVVPSYSKPVPVIRSTSSWGIWFDNNPLIFVIIFTVVIRVLQHAAMFQVRLDGDVALLIIFAVYCLGLHTPRPMVGGFDRAVNMIGTVQPPPDGSGRELLVRSMMQSTPVHLTSTSARDGIADASNETAMPAGSVVEMTDSPIAKLPEGAKFGSHSNCWSEPVASSFEVRGANYLVDHKKIPSADFLFPCRGMDLLLTDTYPENVGRNPLILGGRLREVPTFIVNLRVPWGVVVFYFEIPERFLPFVKAAYSEDVDVPSTDDMTPAERTVCRFLMKDQTHKNKTKKVIANVIEGPWVVRQVVRGKPAIIGNKLPVQYYYGAEGDGKALYLEADWDVAASPVARGILSVTRTYTQMLTLDIGFIVQGNAEDELPEQMLAAICLHQINPLIAPAYPPMHEDFLYVEAPEDDSGSLTPVEVQTN